MKVAPPVALSERELQLPCGETAMVGEDELIAGIAHQLGRIIDAPARRRSVTYHIEMVDLEREFLVDDYDVLVIMA